MKRLRVTYTCGKCGSEFSVVEDRKPGYWRTSDGRLWNHKCKSCGKKVTRKTYHKSDYVED